MSTEAWVEDEGEKVENDKLMNEVTVHDYTGRVHDKRSTVNDHLVVFEESFN